MSGISTWCPSGRCHLYWSTALWGSTCFFVILKCLLLSLFLPMEFFKTLSVKAKNLVEIPISPSFSFNKCLLIVFLVHTLFHHPESKSFFWPPIFHQRHNTSFTVFTALDIVLCSNQKWNYQKNVNKKEQHLTSTHVYRCIQILL